LADDVTVLRCNSEDKIWSQTVATIRNKRKTRNTWS
jgi:hypothetical protein